MNESKIDNSDPSQEKQSLRTRRIVLGASATAMALTTGVAGLSNMVNRETAPHMSETEITEASRGYQDKIVAYADKLMDRIPEDSQVVSLQPEKGSTDAAYELMSASPTGRTTMVLRISSGENRPVIASMNIAGTKEVDGKAIESVEANIAIDEDSLSDGDGMLTRQDFVHALNGVELDDVRSIVVFSPGSPKIHGTFDTYKAPVFMDETGTHIVETPPSAEEIARIIDEVVS